jgi:hypothetical protein
MRIADAMMPGGYFINFEPAHDNFLFRKIRKYIYEKNSLFDAETECAYDLEELNRFYSRAGLNLVDQMYPGLLGYILYYNPDAFPWLNMGTESWVRWLFRLEKYFYRTRVGKRMSFATLSLLKKENS